MKRVVVVFDGTLTYSDTLIPFMRYTLGNIRFGYALLRNILWLVMYKIGLYPNWKAKQHLFATCFAGWSVKDFEEAGERLTMPII